MKDARAALITRVAQAIAAVENEAGWMDAQGEAALAVFEAEGWTPPAEPVHLRRAHTCQIRTTSRLDSPLCGKPAYTTRQDWLTPSWTCPEHARNDPRSDFPGVLHISRRDMRGRAR